MSKKNIVRKLVLFFVLSFIISWILWLPSVLNSNGFTVPDIFLLFSQFALLGPAIAAVILLGVFDGKSGIKGLFKSAWNWKFKKTWLLAILVLPVGITALSIAIKLLIEKAPFMLGTLPAPIYIFAIMLIFIGGPLEEFGWRGYALPLLLKNHSLLTSSIILGVLHGIWHLPLHFINGTVQSHIPIYEFVLVTAVGAIIYSWIFVNTNGSLTAMILHHWAGNFSSALLLYWDTTLGRWIFFGVQLVVAIIIVISYRKKNKKLQEIA